MSWSQKTQYRPVYNQTLQNLSPNLNNGDPSDEEIKKAI